MTTMTVSVYTLVDNSRLLPVWSTHSQYFTWGYTNWEIFLIMYINLCSFSYGKDICEWFFWGIKTFGSQLCRTVRESLRECPSDTSMLLHTLMSDIYRWQHGEESAYWQWRVGSERNLTSPSCSLVIGSGKDEASWWLPILGVSALSPCFEPLALLVWQQEVHPACKNVCHLTPVVLFWNSWRNENQGGQPANQSSPGKWPLCCRYFISPT